MYLSMTPKRKEVTELPRVLGLTQEQKLKYNRQRMANECKELAYQSHVSQTQIAEFIGKTPAAVSSQFKSMNISTEVLMAVVTLANVEPERVKKMLSVN